MPAKIRLQRHGKKGNAYFHIVVADGRAPRDGKFIEKIGTYNPTTNPASIEIDHEAAIGWLKNGAQPTDTCRAILSYKGVLMRYHLHKGVLKGALTQEQADAKLEKWLQEKQAKVEAKKGSIADSTRDEMKKRLDAEAKANAARAAKIAAKNAAAVEVPETPAAAEETAAPAEENKEG
ncbi:MAG: 30S ribosomal protein S16 [Bacteroidetes bacterium]|nr:MAG: 30S ribosomal protein S16 [Bacteroidota bacterium]